MDSIKIISVFTCLAVYLVHPTVSQDTTSYSRDGNDQSKLGDNYYMYVRPVIHSVQVNCELNLKRMEEMVDSLQQKINTQQQRIDLQQDSINSLQGIRLVTTATVQPNPSENAVSGRLEVYLKGQWGTVCDDFFEDVDASVACKQLGGEYNGIGKVVPNSATTAGTGPIWLDFVGCTGSEASLLQCYNRGIGVHNCGHDEDIGVKCYKN